MDEELMMWMGKQVEAADALVYEQHTANLIALLAARVHVGDRRMVEELDAEIEVRMGLR